MKSQLEIDLRMKKTRLLLSIVIVVLITWVLYEYRIRIETSMWHLRHGTRMTVNGYIVPVPQNWHVEDEENGGELLVRLDTDDRTRHQELKAHASILVSPPTLVENRDINFWVSLERNTLKKSGAETISERTLRLDGEVLACLGDNMPGQKGVYDIEPQAWHCRSSSGLELVIRATQPDLNQVWDIVSRIKKSS